MNILRIELANKIKDGRVVGNLYCLYDRGPEGRHCRLLGQYETLEEAERALAAAKRGAK